MLWRWAPGARALRGTPGDPSRRPHRHVSLPRLRSDGASRPSSSTFVRGLCSYRQKPKRAIAPESTTSGERATFNESTKPQERNPPSPGQKPPAEATSEHPSSATPLGGSLRPISSRWMLLVFPCATKCDVFHTSRSPEARIHAG